MLFLWVRERNVGRSCTLRVVKLYHVHSHVHAGHSGTNQGIQWWSHPTSITLKTCIPNVLIHSTEHQSQPMLRKYSNKSSGPVPGARVVPCLSGGSSAAWALPYWDVLKQRTTDKLQPARTVYSGRTGIRFGHFSSYHPAWTRRFFEYITWTWTLLNFLVNSPFK